MEDVDIIDVEFEFQQHFQGEYGEFCQTIKTTIRECIKIFEEELLNLGLKTNFINASWIQDKYFDYIESTESRLKIFNEEVEKLKTMLPTSDIAHLRLLTTGAIYVALLKNFPRAIEDIEHAFFLAQCIFTMVNESVVFRGGHYRSAPSPDMRIKNKFAQKGAAAKNKENREMKAEIFNWLNQNMHSYKTMDEAAMAIAEKIVSVKFRTVRCWITEWKKLRSAGTR